MTADATAVPAAGSPGDPALAETLDALELPPPALRRWLEDGAAFCRRHGGAPRYAELLALYEECLGLLAARRA